MRRRIDLLIVTNKIKTKSMETNLKKAMLYGSKVLIGTTKTKTKLEM